MRKVLVLVVVVASLAGLAGCGGGGQARNPDPTIPSEALVTSTTEPAATSSTAAPTVPMATPVPVTLGTFPATTAAQGGSDAGGLGGGGDVTAAPTLAPLPTAGAPPTTVSMLSPPECSPGGISASTGLSVTGLSCRAGWATATLTPCPVGQPCPNREVFHLSGDGSGRVEWVHLGAFDATCAEHLSGAGMTIGTAAYLAAPVCNPENATAATNIPPGSQDPRVPALQVALISVGYNVAVDGTYGPGTEAAVRDFQRQVGLEVDGIAGPNTQAALGM